jgi:hypothetical protein
MKALAVIALCFVMPLLNVPMYALFTFLDALFLWLGNGVLVGVNLSFCINLMF